MRARGVTLVEVLVAVAVLAIAVLALVRLAAGAARAERTAQVRREAAARLGDELALQRSLKAGACIGAGLPAGWGCDVERTCAPGCDLETVRVRLTTPDGGALEGVTAVWWPLERAPAGAAP